MEGGAENAAVQPATLLRRTLIECTIKIRPEDVERIVAVVLAPADSAPGTAIVLRQPGFKRRRVRATVRRLRPDGR